MSLTISMLHYLKVGYLTLNKCLKVLFMNMQSRRGTVQFGITIPRSSFNSTEEIVNHTCVFELRRMTGPLQTALECEIPVTSVLSHIVPHCINIEDGEKPKSKLK